MRKILVFKIPAKLVLEAAGRKIEEEKKSFESRVTSSTKLCIPSTIKTQFNLILPERIYNSHYGNGVPAMFTS